MVERQAGPALRAVIIVGQAAPDVARWLNGRQSLPYAVVIVGQAAPDAAQWLNGRRSLPYVMVIVGQAVPDVAQWLNGRRSLPYVARWRDGRRGLPYVAQWLNGRQGLPYVARWRDGRRGLPDQHNLILIDEDVVIMNPRRKRRLTVVSIILITLASATGLVLYALSQNIDLFYTPTELVEGKGAAQVRPEVGQRLRIGGLVVPGSVERIGDGLTMAFDLIDEGPATVTVEYTGILPDLFREGQGIVAQGELIAPNRIRANEVLAKHDEEYMPPELADALKGIRHVPPSEWPEEDNSDGGRP